MELLIVRHGETTANIRSVIQGQTQGRLSKKGELQAKNVGKLFKNEKIDRIFSSDLKRAVETADEIARFKDVPIYRMKWLRGRDSGVYEGKKWEEVVAEIGKRKAFDDIYFKFGGGESMVEMHRRLKRFVDALTVNHGDETVVICTHRHCVTVLMSVLFNVPMNKVLEHMKGVKDGQIVGNTEVVRLHINGRKVKYLGDNENVIDIMKMAKN
jgi:broad specificity phosphatase PhoE